MKQLLTFIVFCTIALFACQKEALTPPEGYETVFLIQSGIGGCGLLFQKLDNSILEPGNLLDFDLDLNVGKEYWIKYDVSPNQGSYCMMGEVVLIIDIKKPYKYK